ncbi:hypothetical protein CTAYLR_005411 [Chrysophaeum taylorii]|uniref:Glycosyl transferase CAP10 domain-containing protein n=1 Tax=Chrysophaeum taylorii TaxID=2483200 RepID=A0AAD7U9U3_9STRA|nr:hypothetical protein CTAYLR_005411 [Chrysophaeum taylorii]
MVVVLAITSLGLVAGSCSIGQRWALNRSKWEPEAALRRIRSEEALKMGQAWSWERVVGAVANRSLADISPPLEDARPVVEIMMGRKYDKHRMMVLENRVIVSPSMVKPGKTGRFVHTMTQVARASELPNTVWVHYAGSKGAAMKSGQWTLPTTVIARHANGTGVMVPNPYFGGGNLDAWDSERKKLDLASQTHNWDKRDPRCFWRGHVRSSRDCAHGFGNYARLQAVSLTACFDDLFDVKCQKGCGDDLNITFTCDERYPPDPDVKRATSSERRKDLVAPTFTDSSDYARYQFLLNLPGSTQGSYSRNLNHLWAMGAVVFLWDSPFVEWYYPALRHGITHVAVNKSTARSAVLEIRNDRKLRQTLLEAAKRVDERLVCGKCQIDFLVTLVNLIHSHYSYGRTLLKNRQDVVDLLNNHTNTSSVKCASDRPRFVELYYVGNALHQRNLSCNVEPHHFDRPFEDGGVPVEDITADVDQPPPST